MKRSLSTVVAAIAEMVVMCLLVLVVLFAVSGCNNQILLTFVRQEAPLVVEPDLDSGQLDLLDDLGNPVAALRARGANASNIYIGSAKGELGAIEVSPALPDVSLPPAASAESESDVESANVEDDVEFDVGGE